MDIADISKVASRKRINEEAEKLREKVSRETAKIIKLKVAQDTAYWDLKEKLHQLENNHERLQQNMVEVQMQHETLSGQYQDELRQRPETLNKLSGTRQICDVLEDYSERLKSTLSRCKADQAALCEGYQRCGGVVRDMRTRQARREDTAQGVIGGLEEKIKLTMEHQTQLVQLFHSSKQQSDEELRELKTKLGAAQSMNETLNKRVNELTREVDLKIHELDTRDNNLSSLQNDMKQLMREYNSRCTEMNNTIVQQEKAHKEATERIESLKTALTNQEQFTKSICDQNNVLQEKLSSVEELETSGRQELELVSGRLEDLHITCDALRRDVASLVVERDALQKDVELKNEMLVSASNSAENLQSQLTNLQNEKTSVLADLQQAGAEAEARAAELEALGGALKECREKVEALEKTLEEMRATNEEKIKELNQTIETKTAETKSKSETITKLMSDIDQCLEERARLERAIERARRDAVAETQRHAEHSAALSAQLEKAEGSIRIKDQEIGKQITMIMEIRGEKEKLQDKISSMQNTIDNVRKELSGRCGAPPRPPPEHDDNACTSPVKQMSPPLPPPRPRQVPDFPRPPAPAPAEPKDSLIFGLLSDSSMDGDVVDQNEINRRFEALQRGERLPPVPLSALRRRRRPRAAGTDQNQISLSQLRDQMKAKEKSFFKNKRPGEAKRFKRTDDGELDSRA